MLYLFTGNNHYLLRQELQKWKDGFVLKHGDLGLTHIQDIENVDFHILTESLFSQGLFGGKKLLIIEVTEKSKKIEEGDGEDDSKNNEGRLEYLTDNISKIPEDTIVLLVLYSPDKRKSLYKKILSQSQEVKNFDTEKNPEGVEDQLKKKYGNRMTSRAIQMLVKYKGNKIELILPEVEKLLISFELIDEKHIREYILPEIEENIFSFVNAIISMQKKEVFSLLENFQENTSVFLLYHSLLANLRTQVYIAFMKQREISSFTIKETLSLGNRGFLVDKRISISYPKLENLYIQLADIDTRMKQGKLLGSEEKDIYFQIERTFLELFV